MEDAQFWKIVNKAESESDGEPEALAESLHAELIKLPAAEIQSFDELVWTKLAAAYSWKLWGAAYLINGGCSDDGFLYFRCWLVSQGQKVYEAAVADPDTLAQVVDPDDDDLEFEDLLSVARDAYKEVTGNEMSFSKAIASEPPEPSGEEWDFDDEEATAIHLPSLSSKYAE